MSKVEKYVTRWWNEALDVQSPQEVIGRRLGANPVVQAAEAIVFLATQESPKLSDSEVEALKIQYAENHAMYESVARVAMRGTEAES